MRTAFIPSDGARTRATPGDPTPANIIAGYQNVVGRLHARGIKVA